MPAVRRMAWALISVAVAAAAVGGVVVLLVTTQPGARLVLRLALPRLASDVSVGRVHGRLVGPLALSGIRMVVDGITIEADSVEVTWLPSALLDRRIALQKVLIDGMAITVDSVTTPVDSSVVFHDSAGPDGPPSPVAIEIEDLEVRRSSIALPGTMHIDQISLDLAGTIRRYSVEGSARVTNPTIEHATVEFAGHGTLERFDITNLRGQVLDGTVDVVGRVSWLPLVEWDLRTEVDRIAYGVLLGDSVSWPGRATVTGTVTGTPAEYRVDATVNVAGPRLTPGAVEVVGTGTSSGMTLERLRGSLLGGTVAVVGAVTWTPRLSWELELQADSIAYGQLTNDARAWPGRASMVATTSGDIDQYRASATVSGTGPRFPPSDIRLSGRGTANGFEFEEARAAVFQGTARIRGSLDWSPNLAWDVGVRLDSVVPAPLLTDSTAWPGVVTVHARSRGMMNRGRPTGTVFVDSLDGTLRHQPIAGTISARIGDRRVVVEDSWLRWGEASITAVGQWADTVIGKFSIDVPDLTELHPRWVGRLKAEGDASGTASGYRISADLDAAGIMMDSLSLESAGGRVTLAVDSVAQGQVALELVGFSSGSFVIDTAAIDLEGTSPDHRVDIEWHSSLGALSLGAHGSLSGRAWQGQLEHFEVAQEAVGAWALSHPVALVLSDTVARVDSLCLRADESYLCASGTWHRTEPWSASATLESFPLAFFAGMLPEGLSLGGEIGGSLAASMEADGALAADIDLTAGPGEISYQLGAETRSFNYRPATLHSTVGPNGLTANASVVLELPEGAEFATVEAGVELPRFRRLSDSLASQPMTGRLDAQLADVSLIRALDPEITQATGRIAADLEFEGVLGDPIAVGEVSYYDGEIVIPDLGVTLQDIQITATGDRSGGLVVDGRMRSGAGVLTLRGTSPLVPSASDPAALTVVGESFQAVNIPEADVVVSPDLKLSMTRDSVDVTGTVIVSKAIVELTEVPTNAIPVSNDIVFVDADTAVRQGPVTVTSAVQIVLGDSVSFRGFGIRADLEGNFRAVDRPNAATTGTGTVTIRRGRYRAYGQDLRIDDGRVIFNGPIDDPGLDLRAYREARDRTIAGLHITGTLQDPEASVYSNPTMSQSEAMSYLMFGRPLEHGNTGEQDRMANAATALGSDMLAQSLGAKVGLEAGIEQGSNPNEAAVVAGTYLSPRLFVAYGVGLFDRINIFRVRYEFTRRWSVQAESGRESSGDVFFTFERN